MKTNAVFVAKRLVVALVIVLSLSVMREGHNVYTDYYGNLVDEYDTTSTTVDWYEPMPLSQFIYENWLALGLVAFGVTLVLCVAFPAPKNNKEKCEGSATSA